MTPWIALVALTVLIALPLRRGRPDEPPLPAGYDGERQLAELRALISAPATDDHATPAPADRTRGCGLPFPGPGSVPAQAT
jgi:hypothetical protein